MDEEARQSSQNFRKSVRASTVVSIFVAIFLFLVGVVAAFLLRSFGLSQGQFSSWSTPFFSPLLTFSIAAASLSLLATSYLLLTGKIRFKMAQQLLGGASLTWAGLVAGLLTPTALGLELADSGAFPADSVEMGDVSESGASVASTVYSLRVDYLDPPEELADFRSEGSPGPYIAIREDDRLWIAANSTDYPWVGQSDQFAESQVMLSTISLPLVSPTVWDMSISLSSLDPRIQHVRDLKPYGSGLMFSNVEVKDSCLVLQVWTLTLSENQLSTPTPKLVWESFPCLDWSFSPEGVIAGLQAGGRLVAESDGSILATVGDFRTGLSSDQNYEGRPEVLASAGSYGKVLRIRPNGSVQVVSSGHRNPQGLFFDARDGKLWSTEHGPSGGGELNLLTQGTDYGWPDTTLGVPYGPNLPEGSWKIGRWGGTHENYEKPILSWLPSIAPSQIIVYSGAEFEAWQGDIIIATLKDESLRRIRLDGNRVLFDERISLGQRVRDLVELGDGRLLLSFDSGRLGILSLAR